MALSSDDSTANWPEAPTYSYSGLEARTPLIMGGAMMTGGLFGLALAGLNALLGVAGTRGLDGSPVLSVVLAAFAVLFMIASVWVARYFARIRVGIALSADGIFAYLKGKPWRFIGWGEIASITRRTTFTKAGQNRLSLLIKAPRYTIQVSETIDRYANLCERLTRYARNHRVPLRASDSMMSVSDIAEL
jgi:hypothetical protein